jgi:hypothetical protein
MSRLRSHPVRAKAALGALLLMFVTGAAACDEDGQTAPERCLDPALPIFDIQTAGAPADDNAQYPCVTRVGHAISQGPSAAPTSTAGSAGKAATASAGKGGSSGDTTATAGAGAGGAP